MDMEQQVVARANAYKLLASSLEPPSTWSDGLVSDLGRHLPCLGGVFGEEAARLAAAMAKAIADREAASVAHARLFVGPFEIDAPPYESLYLDRDRRLMGETSMAVAKAYAEAGLAPLAGPMDAPDHVTHEMEFMYFLLFEAVRTGDPDPERRAARFWRDHLGRWLDAFAGHIAKARRHPFYDALAGFLAAFAAAEARLFEGSQ